MANWIKTLKNLIGIPIDGDIATDIANVQTDTTAILALDGSTLTAIPVPAGMALEATLGTPTDTDIATDIVNVQTVVDLAADKITLDALVTTVGVAGAGLTAVTADIGTVFQEVLTPGTFDLSAIPTTVASPPPSATAANSVVDIDVVALTTHVLRSLWVNVTSFGTGATMTFGLWVTLNSAVTQVDEAVVSATGIQNLMDLFGLPQIFADGIWVTAIVDVGSTGACEGTYMYATAS